MTTPDERERLIADFGELVHDDLVGISLTDVSLELMERALAMLRADAPEIAALRKDAERDGHNVCEALVEGFHFEWSLAKGCRCGSCRTFKMTGWEGEILAEDEDQRGFMKAIAALSTQAPKVTPTNCSQCGQPYSDPACGPTHAMIFSELAPPQPTKEGVR
jgi:hypothetical protein